MSTEIEKLYAPTFKNNVVLLSQQRKSKLQALVSEQPCEGNACAVQDQYGTINVREKTERHEDTKYSDTPRARRWLVPREFYTAELYDKSDVVRMLTDPQSPLIQVHMAGMERAKDSVILGCAFAAAPTGETALSGTTPYDTNNDIAADIDLTGTPSGLSPFKLTKSKGRLLRNKVDLEANGVPNCVIPTKAWEDLFGAVQFISTDYNPNKPLQQAPTSIYYGGANLTQIEHVDFPVNSVTEYYLPYFVKSAIVLGSWSDLEVTVQRHPLKVSSYEVKVTQRFNAVRVEEAKVVRTKIKFS